MREHGLLLICILPYKDGRIRVSENLYSRIFYAVLAKVATLNKC